MNKFIKKLFVLMLVVAPLLNTNVQLEAKRVSSGTTGGMRTKSNSTIRTKNNYAKSQAKQKAMKNNQSSTKTKSKSRGFGSFLGGLFLGGLLFGNGTFLSSVFNLIIIFFIIRYFVRIFTRKKRPNNFQTENNNTYYNADMTPLFNELDKLVEEANERDIDVSDILNNDSLTIHEKLNLIRNTLR